MHSLATVLSVTSLTLCASAQVQATPPSQTPIQVDFVGKSFATLRVDWPTFGNGPAHTGYFPDALGNGTLQSGWTISLGQDLQQVAVGAGRVYVTPRQHFSDAWLKAFDTHDGSAEWTYTFNGCFSINPPTFDGGKVYAQRGNDWSDTQLWSFHSDTGTPIWTAPHTAQWNRYLAPCVADGKVWVNGGSSGGMYGFAQADGGQLFHQALPPYDGWTPSYSGGRLYSWVEGRFRRHDATTGAQQWIKDVGWSFAGWSMNRTSAIANSRAYVVGNPDLYALDLTTGQIAWTINGLFSAGTPAVANGVVYAFYGDGFVIAYDAWTGQYLGVYYGEIGLIDQPLVLDDLVLFASVAKTFVYHRASFALYTVLPAGGHLSLANGKLYIASIDGTLHTYDFTPTTQPQPNLVADWQPWTIVAGGRTSVLSLTNYGLANAPPARFLLVASDDTKYDVGDTLLRSLPTAVMLPGETRASTVRVPSGTTLMGKYLLAIPDADDALVESNENNVAPSTKIP